MTVSESDKLVKAPVSNETIQIAGAGPAGLAAAITLARAGRPVSVHEMYDEVGHRFGRDLQGLENWSTERDALAILQDLGITTDFETIACRRGMAFDAKDRAYKLHSHEPLFYLVERGPGSGSLDQALLNQARELGVEVRFNSRLDHIHGLGILAIGPKAADAIAVGYHFDTDMENGFWAICDDNLAPKGYAYLLVMNGRGTVKSCMFTGFKQEKLYVQRTVAAFERLAGLRMSNPQPHGGVGNFYLPAMAQSGEHPIVGEQAGFQDTLWGFGMRHAIHSGVLAANSLLTGADYNALWQQQMRPQMEASVLNRVLFSTLGNRGYQIMLRNLSNSRDPRAVLRSQYRPGWIKRLLVPWARRRYASRRKDKSCDHVDCSCVWCRCGGANAADSTSA